MTAGPVAFFAGGFAVIFFYFRYRDAAEPKRHPSIAMYFLGVAIVAVVTYVIGTAMGIWAACSVETAGNLCGLIGVFGLGPLLAGIAMFVYAVRWSKNACLPP